jgi:hypothetical protein
MSFEPGKFYRIEDMQKELFEMGIRIRKGGAEFQIYRENVDNSLRYLFQFIGEDTYRLHDVCEKGMAYLINSVERVI